MVDLRFRRGMVYRESQQEVTKVVSLVKMAENVPSVSIHSSLINMSINLLLIICNRNTFIFLVRLSSELGEGELGS